MKKHFETLSAIQLAEERVARGTVVELEVDESGQPVSRIYRGRVRRLNVATPPAGSSGEGVAESLELEARQILDDAKAEAEKLVAKAGQDAKQILDDAKAEAEKLVAAAAPPPPPPKK